MGEAINHLIALAGRIRVSGYERVSTLGNRVHVNAYFRSPAKMGNLDLFREQRDFAKFVTEPDGGVASTGLPSAGAVVNRRQQLLSEILRRQRTGRWDLGQPDLPKGTAWATLFHSARLRSGLQERAALDSLTEQLARRGDPGWTSSSVLSEHLTDYPELQDLAMTDLLRELRAQGLNVEYGR